MKLSYKLVIAAFFFTVIGSFIWSVRGGAKRRRSHHRGASGGSGWRLAPRNNFMVETLEKNRNWTRYFLARELRKSLKPERRRR